MNFSKMKFLLFTLFMLYGCKSTNSKHDLSKNGNLLKYEDDENKISFYYPKKWKISEIRQGEPAHIKISIIDSINRIISNIEIIIHKDIKNNVTLNDYNEFILSKAGNISNDNEIISSDVIYIDKNKSMRSILIFTFNNRYKMKLVDILILKNNRAYIIKYGASEVDFDYYIPMIDKIVKSIKLY